jgi:putative drug exporter of the RND superfamily
MDTFLVRTLLVPSTVVLLGRWNWWPSQLRQDRAPDISAPTVGEVAPAAAGEAP